MFEQLKICTLHFRVSILYVLQCCISVSVCFWNNTIIPYMMIHVLHSLQKFYSVKKCIRVENSLLTIFVNKQKCVQQLLCSLEWSQKFFTQHMQKFSSVDITMFYHQLDSTIKKFFCLSLKYTANIIFLIDHKVINLQHRSKE